MGLEIENVMLEATQAHESARSAHKRIDAVERELKDIHELAQAMAAISTKVDVLTSDMEEIKTEVKKVAERPGKWWDKLIAAALGAIAAGIVGAILSVILVK